MCARVYLPPGWGAGTLNNSHHLFCIQVEGPVTEYESLAYAQSVQMFSWVDEAGLGGLVPWTEAPLSAHCRCESEVSACEQLCGPVASFCSEMGPGGWKLKLRWSCISRICLILTRVLLWVTVCVCLAPVKFVLVLLSFYPSSSPPSLHPSHIYRVSSLCQALFHGLRMQRWFRNSPHQWETASVFRGKDKASCSNWTQQ